MNFIPNTKGISLFNAMQEAMAYTLKNNVEVGFNYNIDNCITLDNITIGTELGYTIDSPNFKNFDIGNFHTHVKKFDQFFSIADFQDIQFYSELTLGVVELNTILLINLKNIDKCDLLNDILKISIENYEQDIYNNSKKERKNNIEYNTFYKIKKEKILYLCQKYNIKTNWKCPCG